MLVLYEAAEMCDTLSYTVFHSTMKSKSANNPLDGCITPRYHHAMSPPELSKSSLGGSLVGILATATYQEPARSRKFTN